MAKVKVLVIKCDKCGFEEADADKFIHVTVTSIMPLDGANRKVKVLSDRDLCLESCAGMPGVNRDA